MIKFSENVVFTALLFAVSAFVLGITVSLGNLARLVPLVVALPTAGLLAVQLILDLVPRLSQMYGRADLSDLFGVDPLRERVQTHEEIKRREGEIRRTEMLIFLWIFLLLLLIYLFGFLVTLPVYTLLYLRIRSGASWLISCTVAAGIYGLLYGLPIIVPSIRLSEGQLWTWL